MLTPSARALGNCLESDETMDDFDYGKTKPDGQHERYPSSVQVDEDGNPAYIQPVRNAYCHKQCKVVTRMGRSIYLTYATNPGFYGRTFCVGCHGHFPLAEFVWEPDEAPMDEVSGKPGEDLRIW